ncbi:glycoside hydrolase family 27 protein [uncultured Sphingomonas sp.]|uniref:glycoside hydrolase family 27 protein n=1 Tax=uncultured Sphingomonas sp. TaxID=158754 RepID=UPI0025CC4E0E|nr:glycoside hydrolase family 27 protein [uncultured Sphingomonas sp.]
MMFRSAAVAALLALASPVYAAKPATDLAGTWLFAPSDDYPGLRMMRLSRGATGWQGMVTSDWYGDLRMRGLEVEGGSLSFLIDNGNPRLPARRWTAEPSGSGMHVTGDIWHRHVDTQVRRGTPADAARLAFPTYPLPAPATLKPDGQASTPPMEWSSWNHFAAAIDDRTIREIADHLVSSGLRDAGYRYINVDDGWQGDRAPDGTIRPNARFPDMKALADYVHARGLKIGIYSSPGPKTCAGFVGSHGHVAQDAASFAAWGIDYLKYDLCSGEGLYRTAAEVKLAYQEMGQALRATGRPIVYSLCQYGRDRVGTWGRDVGGHLWRTTGDIEDTYASMSGIGFDRNGDPAAAGPGGWNDPDMLEAGNGGMSDDEYRTHMTLWAIMAAPLMLGNDLRTMSPATIALLENRGVIAIDQDPLGRQGRRIRKDGGAEIWAKPLRDGSVAIALFNRSEAARPVAFTAEDASLKRIGSLRDVWAGVPDNPARRSWTLPAHGAVLLRLK